MPDGMFDIETEAPSTSNIRLHLEKQRLRVAVAYSLQTGEDLRYTERNALAYLGHRLVLV